MVSPRLLTFEERDAAFASDEQKRQTCCKHTALRYNHNHFHSMQRTLAILLFLVLCGSQGYTEIWQVPQKVGTAGHVPITDLRLNGDGSLSFLSQETVLYTISGGTLTTQSISAPPLLNSIHDMQFGGVQNRYHMVYGRSGSPFFYYGFYDGSTWETYELPCTTLKTPALAVAETNEAFISYNTASMGFGNVYLVYIEGGVVEQELVEMFVEGNGQVAVDHTGTVYTFYRASSDNWMAKRVAPASWQKETIPFRASGVHFDVDNDPHYLFTETGSLKLYHVQREQGVWRHSLVDEWDTFLSAASFQMILKGDQEPMIMLAEEALYFLKAYNYYQQKWIKHGVASNDVLSPQALLSTYFSFIHEPSTTGTHVVYNLTNGETYYVKGLPGITRAEAPWSAYP